jgi:membrane-associated PAP2 superfamily phosphatase
MPPASAPKLAIVGFYALHLALPAVVMAALLTATYAFDLDRLLIAPFYDATSRRFPLRHDFIAEHILHRVAQHAGTLLELGLASTFLLSFWNASLRHWRRVIAFLVLALLLAPATVNGLKVASNQYCPSELSEYGGKHTTQPRLFAPPAPGEKSGRCWPGGHASMGFSFMALYLVCHRLGRRRAAAVALALGFAFGFALGYVRIMQGAHFLSHNLWSAAVCWTVIVVLYALILGEHRLPEAFSDHRGAC